MKKIAFLAAILFASSTAHPMSEILKKLICGQRMFLIIIIVWRIIIILVIIGL